jgi:tetratricopeptide (TPR) repeat protein
VWSLVALFAVGAGFVLARSAGSRGADDEITGAIRLSTRERLADCLEVGRTELLEGIKCYDAVLEDEPANPEAMAYRGWLLYRTGDVRLAADGYGWIDRAVTADPTYPDALAFRAIVHRDLGQDDRALADLDALEALDPPPIISDLISQFAIRESIEARDGSVD